MIKELLVSTALLCLFDNGTKMRYEWWEDDGGAIIQHKSSISLEMPTELGKLITPDPINFEIAIHVCPVKVPDDYYKV